MPAQAATDDVSAATNVVAHNQVTVIQAIWQEQTGCRTYCYGTSQTQSANQTSSVEQIAAADGSGLSSAPTNASAMNESSTYQFVFQSQIGCVAFCYGTSQSQSAAQQALTSQAASAYAQALALALNLATSLQSVVQQQQGCRLECHDTSASQSAEQGSSTDQSASSTPGSVGEMTADTFFALVSALAQNISATFMAIIQTQIADCLDHCVGDALVQEAFQSASVTQSAAAAAPPPPVTDPTSPPTSDGPPAPPDPGVSDAPTPPDPGLPDAPAPVDEDPAVAPAPRFTSAVTSDVVHVRVPAPRKRTRDFSHVTVNSHLESVEREVVTSMADSTSGGAIGYARSSAARLRLANTVRRGQQTFDRIVRSNDSVAVVTRSHGSTGVFADQSIGGKGKSLGWLEAGLLGGALLLVVAGGAGLWFASRRR